MQTAFNPLNYQQNQVNQPVANAPVASAIKVASARTGVDFSYMLNNAKTESSMNPEAKASGSSATGLYQFVEQTWFRMIKAYGDKYGMSDVAGQISIGSDGVARVSDKASRQAILNLRKDPQVSSQMAAELTNENREALQEKVGGKIGSTELYLAHFLGASGASSFLNKMHSNPQAKAADFLPTAASANPSIFYDKSGNARSLGQIYQNFARKFDGNDAIFAKTSTQVASANTKNTISPTDNFKSLVNGLGLGDKGMTSSMMKDAEDNNSYVNSLVMAQASLTENGSLISPVDMLYKNSVSNTRRKEGIAAYLGIAA